MITRRHTLGLLSAVALIGCAPRTRSSARPVDWEGFITAGGIEQWMSIRGSSADNPAMLFLHGGPGEALSPFPSIFERYERSFVVVNWDQRGAGRTQGRKPAKPEDMSLEQAAQDAIEVAKQVCGELGKDKVVLVGQSWGSMVGWRAALERPDLFHAFVGTGHVVSWEHSLNARERYAREQAEAAGDQAALDAIDAAQALPIEDPGRMAPLRGFLMPPADQAFLDMQGAFIGEPPYPEEGEVADWISGFLFSSRQLWEDSVTYDAYEVGLRAHVPVIVIQGSDDRFSPSDAAEQFVRDVVAPRKAFVPIEGGHFACYTNPEGFVAALEEHVLPLIA